MSLKTPPVYFHVQRKTPFTKTGSVVTFDREILNVGDAMDAESGTFIAPTSGIYYFSISGISSPNSGSLSLSLMKNGEPVGAAFARRSEYDTFALSSTLELEVDDVITVFLKSGYIHDEVNSYTNFNGLLLRNESM